MASIQQSFNQMLMSAQIGAGLYAHSPAGQEEAEVRKLQRTEPKIQKQIELTGEKVGPEPSAADEAFTEVFKAGTAQAKRLFELRPTEKNLAEYKEMSETLDEWESALKLSQEKRQQTLADQKVALENRKKLLEGTPEENRDFTYRKTKVKVMEEEKDGK